MAEETPAEKRARIHGISVSMNLASGDAERGKPLFAKHCGICHTLFGEGNKVGPDLTGAERKNRDFLLTSIVDPNAVIRKEFFNYVVQTKDGRVLTGLIVESTPTLVTILDAKNQRTTLAQDEVDATEPSQPIAHAREDSRRARCRPGTRPDAVFAERSARASRNGAGRYSTAICRHAQSRLLIQRLIRYSSVRTDCSVAAT